MVIAMIDLKEGPRIMSNVIDVDPDPAQLVIGRAVQVAFQECGSQVLPVFRLTRMDAAQ